MLAGYYHSIGLYTFSSSSERENEGELFAPNELSHYSNVSANSCPDANKSTKPAINVKQFLVASTSDFEDQSLYLLIWSYGVHLNLHCHHHHHHHHYAPQQQSIEMLPYHLMQAY